MFIAAIVNNWKQLSWGMDKLQYINILAYCIVVKIIDLYQYASISINIKNIMLWGERSSDKIIYTCIKKTA